MILISDTDPSNSLTAALGDTEMNQLANRLKIYMTFKELAKHLAPTQSIRASIQPAN